MENDTSLTPCPIFGDHLRKPGESEAEYARRARAELEKKFERGELTDDNLVQWFTLQNHLSEILKQMIENRRQYGEDQVTIGDNQKAIEQNRQQVQDLNSQLDRQKLLLENVKTTRDATSLESTIGVAATAFGGMEKVRY